MKQKAMFRLQAKAEEAEMERTMELDRIRTESKNSENAIVEGAKRERERNGSSHAPKQFFLTIMGATEITAPTLAQEFMDLRDLLQSGSITMADWDRHSGDVGRMFVEGCDELQRRLIALRRGGLEHSGLNGAIGRIAVLRKERQDDDAFAAERL